VERSRQSVRVLRKVQLLVRRFPKIPHIKCGICGLSRQRRSAGLEWLEAVVRKKVIQGMIDGRRLRNSSRGRRRCRHSSPVAVLSRVSCQPAPDSTSMATCGMVTFQQAVRKTVLGFLKRDMSIAVSRLHSANGCNLAMMERLCLTLRRSGGQNSRGIETRSTSTFRDDLGPGGRSAMGYARLWPT
jgi:hypothetical protein